MTFMKIYRNITSMRLENYKQKKNLDHLKHNLKIGFSRIWKIGKVRMKKKRKRKRSMRK